jgi:hypothetical protein
MGHWPWKNGQLNIGCSFLAISAAECLLLLPAWVVVLSTKTLLWHGTWLVWLLRCSTADSASAAAMGRTAADACCMLNMCRLGEKGATRPPYIMRECYGQYQLPLLQQALRLHF